MRQIGGVGAVNVFPCLPGLNVCFATIGNSQNATYSTNVDVTGDKTVGVQYITIQKRLSGSHDVALVTFSYLPKTNWKGLDQYEGALTATMLSLRSDVKLI